MSKKTPRKKCESCREIKPHYEFTERKYSPDGRAPLCRICNREKRKKTLKVPKPRVRDQFNLRGITKEDYCNMYKLLEILGYNPKKDIHQQFCDKFGIRKYKRRNPRQMNQYNYQDCKEKPEN